MSQKQENEETSSEEKTQAKVSCRPRGPVQTGTETQEEI